MTPIAVPFTHATRADLIFAEIPIRRIGIHVITVGEFVANIIIGGKTELGSVVGATNQSFFALTVVVAIADTQGARASRATVIRVGVVTIIVRTLRLY